MKDKKKLILNVTSTSINQGANSSRTPLAKNL